MSDPGLPPDCVSHPGTRSWRMGAIAGPLLALVLVAFAIRQIPARLAARQRQPVQIRIRPVTRGRLGRLMLGVGAFELGHAAATLLILRATTVLSSTFSCEVAVRTAIALYLGYNAIAAGLSFAGGRAADRRGGPAVLGLGVAAFLIAYLAFAFASGLGIVAAGFAVASSRAASTSRTASPRTKLAITSDSSALVRVTASPISRDAKGSAFPRSFSRPIVIGPEVVFTVIAE